MYNSTKDLENILAYAPTWSRSVPSYSCSSDMLSQANRFRINRKEKSEIITDKEGTRTKPAGRYGRFKGNAGRDEMEP
jgi:hypothetical protein